MAKRPYDLPSMSSLLCFEAAARHQSFKDAAGELNVTPAAISHQVKALENEIQRPLFRRYHRGVELTESGAYLFVALQRSFEGISDAVTQLKGDDSDGAVTIQATTAMSSLWLTPKLAKFWNAYGNIAVAQRVSDISGVVEKCDLSIHYGDIERDTGDCRVLFRDRIMALCSPEFAERYKIDDIAELAHTPLIHLETEEPDWTDWRSWCSALGYSGPLARGFKVNNYMIAIQAAQDNMGAVLGWDGLTAHLVESGTLVKLLPDEILSPLDFYIKIHPRASANALLVCDWLMASQKELTQEQPISPMAEIPPAYSAAEPPHS